MSGGDTNKGRDKAREVFWRFDEVHRERGHVAYMQRAKRLEDLYFGGGRQWLADHRAIIEGEGRPCREVNTILPTVNAAIGYQIASRVDIMYAPKSGLASQEGATNMSKVTKHVLDNTDYRYAETEAFRDGLVQQRGYIDIRMDYEDSIDGEIKITTLDPLDVIPDPDAKSYNPDQWADVHVTRWLTCREIESIYGKAAADAVKNAWHGYGDEKQWGAESVKRAGFGNDLPPSYAMGAAWIGDNEYTRRYRIVDKQYHEYANSLVAVFPGNDLRVVEGYPPEHLAWLMDNGVNLITRRVRRVKWEVCAPEVMLFDDFSPFEHFTVIPYFPFFSRGQTMGMVDNMEGPQETLNKFVSQYEHVVNSAANGGWQGEADSLTNMSDDEFTDKGASTGLVLLRKQGAAPFEKIQPGQIPTGLDRMIEFASNHLNIVSGVDPAGMQIDRNDMSGIALQSLEYAQQKKLAIVLDNLSRTRQMVADRTRKLIQRYMGNERVIRITEVDDYGAEQQVPLALNVRQADGTILNDLTMGEYNITVAERPANVTFNNSEFEQIKAMKEMGIQIPDAVVIRASNLADKNEIAEAMRAQTAQVDPRAEAAAALSMANARLADEKAVGERVKSLFAAIQTAQAIVVTPQSAAIADQIAKSAGFTDQDMAPIYPADVQQALPAPITQPGDTSPLTPANPVSPAIGLNAGMTDAPDNPPQ